MPITTERILEALRSVKYPGYDRDIVAAGVARDVEIDGDVVRLVLDLGRGDPKLAPAVESSVRETLSALDGVARVEFRRAAANAEGAPSLKVLGSKASAAAEGSTDPGLIPGVRHTVAVASGKGGVGKSTVAVNLAVAMARHGAKVGLLDADIYGPSVPIMTGLQDEKGRMSRETGRLLPFERFGVRLMSLGFLVDPESAVIWRGPMVMKAIEQLLREVDWGELDVLVVDMPPGTGDAQLTLSQRVRLAGAVIVTTPQDVALADAIKGVAMFRKVNVPVLGLIENMSYYECPDCSHRAEIFGHGGGKAQAERLHVPFLGEVPLDPAIRDSGDRGTPIVAAQQDDPVSRAFMDIAGVLLEGLAPDSAAPDPSASPGIFERFRQVWKPGPG